MKWFRNAESRFGILVILAYLALRFPLDGFYARLHPLFSYGIEIIFAIAVGIGIYRKRLALKVNVTPRFMMDLIFSWAFGYLVYRVAQQSGLLIPWDLNDSQNVLFLLLIGPLLEEFLFRHALWWPLAAFNKSMTRVILLSAILFAWGHLFAIFIVPQELYSFVLFQTAYTFLVSCWWGVRFVQTQSLATPIALHFLFNLGFYSAFRLS
ncbi:MAG: CPBP family intramembrane metalloprotease [Oligoflexia bacterium]|nr:CPBP family intramembrane metalloprotease [Oligoflexia bacterium]